MKLYFNDNYFIKDNIYMASASYLYEVPTDIIDDLINLNLMPNKTLANNSLNKFTNLITIANTSSNPKYCIYITSMYDEAYQYIHLVYMEDKVYKVHYDYLCAITPKNLYDGTNVSNNLLLSNLTSAYYINKLHTDVTTCDAITLKRNNDKMTININNYDIIEYIYSTSDFKVKNIDKLNKIEIFSERDIKYLNAVLISLFNYINCMFMKTGDGYELIVV